VTAQRRICIVTGTRAEYGLLHGLMKEVAGDPDLQLQVIATGMHLSPEFGLTYRQIEADGFAIDARVEMLLSSDSAVGVAKSMGVGTMGCADALARLGPDILVLLGDRFEALAAAQAALVARLPIAHIHGGETTEGAFDESIRHAITKMAQWHFVAAEPYRRRVIQLGETPDRVFNVGSPGLDHLDSIDWPSRSVLEASLDLPLGRPTFLVTYHPSTLGYTDPGSAMDELLAALDDFPDATVVFTYPNADTGSRDLIERLHRWVAAHPSRSRAFDTLGRDRYLAVLRAADVVVGNSSSGLTEAPALHIATVNIGDRQKGRLKASSVLDADENRASIAVAIRRALSPEFQDTLAGTLSLYGSGDASHRIKDTLKTVALGTRKIFFDIEYCL
jgi:UDP-hydrolysing UDP-N-acetyl-D-glucosamine 2-epimerase